MSVTATAAPVPGTAPYATYLASTTSRSSPGAPASSNGGYAPALANSLYANAWSEVASGDAAPATTGGGSPGGAPGQVVQFAQDKLGTRYANGECFSLADDALKQNGFKSAADYGHVTPNADYKWGQPVDINDAKPGDVIQFKNFKDQHKETNADGSYTTTTQTRPHHTAVVVSNDGHGRLTVVEQNIHSADNKNGAVQQTQLDFQSGTWQNGDTTVSTQTSGQAICYRPQPK